MPPRPLGVDGIGERIKTLRKKRGWTCVELGRRTGISRGLLAKIECGVSGDIKLSQALALAQALDVQVEDLAWVDPRPGTLQWSSRVWGV